MAQITFTVAEKQLRKLNDQRFHSALLFLTKRWRLNMIRIIDLEIGDEVQVETGYTNWNRADNEFYCTMSGISEDGMVILDAKNSVCFDGRNRIQPFFVVDSNTMIERVASYNKIPGCYVLWHITGMDRKGRFILKTRTE